MHRDEAHMRGPAPHLLLTRAGRRRVLEHHIPTQRALIDNARKECSMTAASTIIPDGTAVFFAGDRNMTATVIASFIGPEQSAERGSEYQPNGNLAVFYHLLLPEHLRFFNPAQDIFVSAIVAHSDGVQPLIQVPTCIPFDDDDPDDCSSHEHER